MLIISFVELQLLVVYAIRLVHVVKLVESIIIKMYMSYLNLQ